MGCPLMSFVSFSDILCVSLLCISLTISPCLCVRFSVAFLSLSSCVCLCLSLSLSLFFYSCLFPFSITASFRLWGETPINMEWKERGQIPTFKWCELQPEKRVITFTTFRFKRKPIKKENILRVLD